MRALTPFLIVMGAAASAAPPPPPEYPQNLPKEVASYRMEAIYPIYFMWLSRQRKEALLAALPNVSALDGRKLWTRIIESEIDSYDYGIVRADRLDRFCDGDWVQRQPAGRCAYRYAYSIVPGSPWNDPTLKAAIAESFRPKLLAERLAAIKWKQTGNDWSDPILRAAFAAHVDPTKFYAPLVRLRSVETDSCPALAKAIADLGKVTFDLSPDAITTPVDVMSPHGSRTQIRLTVADPGGRAIVVSGATPLHETLAPIWTAVEECAPVR